MSIQIYIGTLGSGKTLSMVRDLYLDFEDRKRNIISNLILSFNSEIVSKEFFNGFAQGQQQELFDVSLGIDEIHIFLDRNYLLISQRAGVQQPKHQSICHILSCRQGSEEWN